MELSKEEKLAKLKGLMKDLNKGQEDTVIDFASNQESWVVAETGVPAFDKFVGGFPYGHTSIVWGGSGAGKSSLMYSTIAKAQQDGKVVAFLDLENSYTNERANLFGVNTQELIVCHYKIAEQALDTVITLAREKAVDMIILDSLHCYDKETMILTNEGWKFFKDLTGTELILTLNNDYETTKYVKINKLIKHKHVGEMYYYKGKHCDFCMTNKNRILFGNPTFKYKFSGWKIDTIQNAINQWRYNHFFLKKDFVWEGESPKWVVISGKKRANAKKLTKIKIKSDVWMKFLGWWLSEGSSGFRVYSSGTQKQCVTVKIHQSLKSPFLSEIEDTLNKMPFKYSRYVSNGEVTYCIHNSLLGRYLIENCISDKQTLYDNKHKGGAKIKNVPKYIKTYSSTLLKIFLDAYYKGDGWLSWSGSRCISTSSYLMALDLKEIYLKCGIYVNISTEDIKPQSKWIVDHWAVLGGKHYTLIPYTTNNFSHMINKENIQTIKYDDYVYDVEINSESHLIYLMRNGTSYWASNSMAPQGEVEDKKGQKSLTSDTMALLARKLSQFFRMASTIIYNANIAFLMIGQTRTDLGGFIALQKLSGGNSLIHSSVLTVYMRRGQKSNAPLLAWKEAYIDPDGKFHLLTKKEPVGFEVVAKIDKKKTNTGEPEGSEVSFPYYLETGFVAPDAQEEIIKIDSTMSPEQQEEARQILVKKGYKQFESTSVDTVLVDTDNNCAKVADQETQEQVKNVPDEVVPPAEAVPEKKKRGRKPKNAS